MTWRKRLFDLFFASLLVVVLGPVLLLLMAWLLLKEGRPLFYVAERMKEVDQPFALWKLRTMQVVDQDTGVSGGDKSARITKTGAWLRAKRLDEFPQLWNILRGDLSFVGPRPPLRQYVEANPDLYARVLKSRPGVTGLASITYHKHEAALLARCTTSEETDQVYSRLCVPMKARLDLIYQRHQSMCYDFDLVFQTIGNLFRRG
ncbi:sugar transferase (plasmid) [Phaeobacter inhibens]|uniref:sugar transferase n=1 Tax=Phaeobacter TaxID=302485 RepID=UPI000160EBF6|nr:sugar transferase [Phaeobacter inhibens]AFO89724.1 putative sugar transferase [Phaeobacter inhibens 2.10]AXT44653.1 sugar transferase [Phaeobacter inhibens]